MGAQGGTVVAIGADDGAVDALPDLVVGFAQERLHLASSLTLCPHHVQIFAHPGVEEALADRLGPLREAIRVRLSDFARRAGHDLLEPVVVDWFAMPLQDEGTATVHLTFGRHRPDNLFEPGDPDELVPTDPPGLDALVRDVGERLTRPMPAAPPAISGVDDTARVQSPLHGGSSLDLSVLEGGDEPHELSHDSPWGSMTDRRGTRVLLRGSVVVGRRAPADLVAPHPTVSTRHALLLCRGPGEFYVHDLQSLNGTEINGNRTSGITRLRGGDIVSFGNFRLRFEEGLP
jgi:hypothetical protein